MQEQFNKITVVAEEKKKKGQGLNAILTLMKDMVNFQDRVRDCIEAQDIKENVDKLAKFSECIEGMYSDLLDMAAPAIKSHRNVRETPSENVTEPVVSDKPSIDIHPEALPASSRVVRPSVPKM